MKKAQRLILCYFLFSLVALASKLLLSSLVNRKVGGLWEGLHAIVFQGGSYWFLYVLFIIFLIFPAIEILIKKSKLWLVGSLIGALYFFDIYPKIFALRLVGYHLIFFFVGYSLAAHYERFKKATLRFQFPLLLISMTLLAITGHSDIHQSKLAAFIIPFFGILTSYVIINMVKFNPINSLLNTFGVYSLQIYLLEPLILVISRYVLVNHLNISDPITLIVLIVILKLCISILAASLILQRFALTRLLCGFSNKRIDNLIRVPAS